MDRSKIEKVLRRMEREDLQQREEGKSREERWRSIPWESGQYLYQQVMIHQPSTIVEIGMSHGFSTIWMGLAANQVGASLYSYEVEKWRYDQALENINEIGLNDVIRPQLIGSDVSVEYPDGIDLVFIDAEKSDYILHFNAVQPLLNEGAIILADNVSSHPEELKSYTKYVRNHKDFYSIPMPVGKGIELTRYMRNSEKNIIESLR